MSTDTTGVQPATQRQLRFIRALGLEADMDAVALDDLAMEHYRVKVSALNRRQASEFIDIVQAKGDEVR